MSKPPASPVFIQFNQDMPPEALNPCGAMAKLQETNELQAWIWELKRLDEYRFRNLESAKLKPTTQGNQQNRLRDWENTGSGNTGAKLANMKVLLANYPRCRSSGASWRPAYW